jgi:WD40-like Beta Propeller Repeat
MRMVLIALLSLAAAPVGGDAPFMPGTVSTAAAEVRIAFRPDGRQILWGAIGRDGPEDQQDIWETHRARGGWSAPARVSFDSDAVEFDPAFSPDGRRLYFHSDRPGGFGGTDIYIADVDAAGRFSRVRNAGATINSAGEEWAPTPTRAGTMIFASDGWRGLGRHELLESAGRGGPRNLGANVNGPDEDFDGALTPDGRTLIFSSGTIGDVSEVYLYRSDRRRDGSWSPRRRIGAGCADFAIGSAFDPRDPGHYYYAAHCLGGSGRMDVRVVPIGQTAATR